MFSRLVKSAGPLFPFPIFVSLVLLVTLNTGCRKENRAVSGELKILYSTDVGGAIDPCG